MSTIAPPFRSHSQKRGFTLVELMVVVGFITLLLVMLLPVIGSIRATARQNKCARNLQQIGLSTKRSEGTMVLSLRASSWPDKLAPYVDDELAVYFCPDDTTQPQAKSSYGMNHRSYKFSGAEDGRKIVMLDYRSNREPAHEAIVVVSHDQPRDDWATSYRPRHRGLSNVLFFDGSVKLMEAPSPEDDENLIRYWAPKKQLHLLALAG